MFANHTGDDDRLKFFNWLITSILLINCSIKMIYRPTLAYEVNHVWFRWKKLCAVDCVHRYAMHWLCTSVVWKLKDTTNNTINSVTAGTIKGCSQHMNDVSHLNWPARLQKSTQLHDASRRFDWLQGGRVVLSEFWTHLGQFHCFEAVGWATGRASGL